ncbi:MAG: glycine--tRNA ligase subunit beta, partial [Alphaproteobacteria bacterium]|nr:glycine--tRNA ligase subunit beta [Alphaproteobacteria bacterium]
LVGFFAINEKPTGSKDPYALRRAALGVLRIVLENNLRLPLKEAFNAAAMGHDKPGQIVGDELVAFFADRLKVHMREEGQRHDLIDAIFALGGEDDMLRLVMRVKALADFLAGEDGANLLSAHRRAANILRIEEKKDGTRHDGAPVATLMRAKEETVLYHWLGEVEGLVDKAIKRERHAEAMKALATLRKPVDEFFDKVKVNDDEAEVRRNRLFILNRIRATLGRVADFSRIEG